MADQLNTFLPFQINELDQDIKKKIAPLYPTIEYYRVVGPDKWILTEEYQKRAAYYYNFKFCPEDVMVMGFLRSGTTMLQELIWLLQNNLDYKTAKEIPTYDRIAALDPFAPIGPQFEPCINGRSLKTHFSFNILSSDLLSRGAKILYIARNPKDVIVSYYHLQRMFSLMDFKGTFEEFYDCVEQNTILYGPYWNHLEAGWKNRNLENVCFMFFEEFIKDLRGGIQKVAKFLNKHLTEGQLDALEDYLCFENLYKNKAVNMTDTMKTQGIYIDRDSNSQYIREGKMGKGQEYFNGRLRERADNWIAENVKKIGIQFPEMF